MPFGTVCWTGPGIRQVVGFGHRSAGRGTFGANVGRAIVFIGNFTAYVCDSAATRPSSQTTLGRLVRFRTKATNTSTTTNYINVADDSMTYNT